MSTLPPVGTQNTTSTFNPIQEQRVLVTAPAADTIASAETSGCSNCVTATGSSVVGAIRSVFVTVLDTIRKVLSCIPFIGPFFAKNDDANSLELMDTRNQATIVPVLDEVVEAEKNATASTEKKVVEATQSATASTEETVVEAEKYATASTEETVVEAKKYATASTEEMEVEATQSATASTEETVVEAEQEDMTSFQLLAPLFEEVGAKQNSKASEVKITLLQILKNGGNVDVMNAAYRALDFVSQMKLRRIIALSYHQPFFVKTLIDENNPVIQNAANVLLKRVTVA
jgi:hypothetical protein